MKRETVGQRIGGLILDEGAVPKVDRYSFTAAGNRYVAHEWLAATLYALSERAGDVTGGMQFTHVASAKGGVAFRNAVLGESATMDYHGIPYGVFTAPEIGHVGITEQEAIDQGLQYQVSRFNPTEIDRSIIGREQVGLVKLIATPGGEQILGAHIIAAHGADLINEMALAMKAGLSVRHIADTIHAYPTLPESLRWASTSFLGE